MKIWDEISALEGDVSVLEKLVNRAVRPVAAKSRETQTLLLQEVEVSLYDMQRKYATYQNGDIDTLEIWRLAMTVSKNDDLTTNPGKRIMLTRAPQGWIEAGITTGLASSTTTVMGVDIDVRWNYVVGSRQTRYSRDNFCNSEMLVGLDKGEALDFRAPLIVPRGEQIEFHVEPATFAVPLASGDVTPNTTKFYVQFHAMGFRRSA